LVRNPEAITSPLRLLITNTWDECFGRAGQLFICANQTPQRLSYCVTCALALEPRPHGARYQIGRILLCEMAASGIVTSVRSLAIQSQVCLGKPFVVPLTRHQVLLLREHGLDVRFHVVLID